MKGKAFSRSGSRGQPADPQRVAHRNDDRAPFGVTTGADIRARPPRDGHATRGVRTNPDAARALR